MRIGIDCRSILNPGRGEQVGIGHYTYCLVKSLLEIDQKNEYVLFFDHKMSNVAEFAKRNVKITRFPFYQYKRYMPFAYSHLLITAYINREKLDVYHAPGSVVSMSYSGNSVATIHDLSIFKHPEWFSPAAFPLIPSQFLSRQIFTIRVLMPQTLKKLDKIITVSENTKKDIMKMFKIDDEKIRVIYEGAGDCSGLEHEAIYKNEDKEKLKRDFGLDRPYIFFIGTLEARKNIAGLVQAYQDLILEDEKFADYNLVLAGVKGYKYQDTFKAIKECNFVLSKKNIDLRRERRTGIERRSGFDTRPEWLRQQQGERRKNPERRSSTYVRYLGYVSAAHKKILMRNAACFVFPSFYEGFGLPVLEAMQAGVPVICSKASSLPEVADHAAVLVNPNNTNDIAKAIKNVLTDKEFADELVKKGLEQVKNFNWQTTAVQTLAVYEEIAKK